MSQASISYDLLVIGGGPSGMKAAIQGAKAGKSVLMVERGQGMGGECVQRGTIPSKTLRETTSQLAGLRLRSAGAFDVKLGEEVKLNSLMGRLKTVLKSHSLFMEDQIARNGISCWRGRASFVDPHRIRVEAQDGKTREVVAETIVIGSGSRPRHPENVPVDHEHILDSDSILSMIYVPESLTVLGAGVIACEFASTFQTLGVSVTMIAGTEYPLAFLDPELSERFLDSFEKAGGRYVQSSKIESVHWDNVSRVVTRLEGGQTVHTQKALCALGRVASVKGLNLDAVGIELTARNHIPVDENCQTKVDHVYAVGDVVGPPALATTSMDQGRRAVRHALGLESDAKAGVIPIGIYTLPEIACIGETEAEVTERLGACHVGRARFSELARGHISGNTDGFLKLVCDDVGKKLLGAQIIGEGAAELVGICQMAIYADLSVEAFIENVFNFPTLAEAYRVAALEIVGRRDSRLAEAA